VYDDNDRLVVIIPPRAVAQLTPDAPSPSWPKKIGAELLRRECYRFTYDDRNRMVEKCLPGVESVFMVYDRWDRLALSQDGNQRSAGRWTFRKYDARDRPIMTGEITLRDDRENVARMVDDFYASNPDWLRYEVAGDDGHGYSNRSFPLLDEGARVDRVLYFDEYAFLKTFDAPDSYAFRPELGVAEIVRRPVGKVTGSKVRVFGKGRFISTARYYDDDARTVQVAWNDHVGGRVRETTEYDFSGNVLNSHVTHRWPGTSVRVLKRRVYDHAQRPTSVRLQIDDEPPVVLCKSEYNSLGQLVRKRLHSVDDGISFAQEIEYRYNIRGWLTSINRGVLESGADASTLFAMQLVYNDELDSLSTVPQFNGNISAVKWRNGQTKGEQAYVYKYDGFDRLVAAQYRVNGAKDRAFDESGITYDPNGNLRRISRYSFISSRPTLVDSLTYRYTGNQVRAIHDSALRNKGFRDADIQGDAYDYDSNGNMVVDRNKGVHIHYNALNRIDEITHVSGESMRFGFDADGLKRFREVLGSDGRRVGLLDYVGDCVLQDENPRLVRHDEGQLIRDSEESGWRFQYFLTDHLGNVRVAFEPSNRPDTKPAIVYAADYYPSGLRLDHGGSDGSGEAPIKRLFAGKELEEALELQWYDFGARMLDPSMGRWVAQDSEAERYPGVSPYSYVWNNPIRYVDPDGRQGQDVNLIEDLLTFLWNQARFETGAKPTHLPRFNPRSAVPLGVAQHDTTTPVLLVMKTLFPGSDRIFTGVRVEGGTVTKIGARPGGPKGALNADAIVIRPGQPVPVLGQPLLPPELVADFKPPGGTIDPKYGSLGAPLKTITGRTKASVGSVNRFAAQAGSVDRLAAQTATEIASSTPVVGWGARGLRIVGAGAKWTGLVGLGLEIGRGSFMVGARLRQGEFWKAAQEVGETIHNLTYGPTEELRSLAYRLYPTSLHWAIDWVGPLGGLSAPYQLPVSHVVEVLERGGVGGHDFPPGEP
jgi:RHS repeat-associated protein